MIKKTRRKTDNLIKKNNLNVNLIALNYKFFNEQYNSTITKLLEL